MTADSLAEGVRGGRHLFFIQEPEDKLLNLVLQPRSRVTVPIEEFVKAAIGVTLGELQSEEGDSAAAARIMLYCQHNGLQPEIAASTKERARHIYRQIEAAGYAGMLLVMDEFAFWQDREKADEQRAADEEALETIGHVLPKDEGANIWTIVASQKAAPTKLKGDRFKALSLLADRNQTEQSISQPCLTGIAVAISIPKNWKSPAPSAVF